MPARILHAVERPELTHLAAQVARVRSEGFDVVTTGEGDIINMYIPAIVTGQDLFTNFTGSGVERSGPGGAVLDESGGHFLVV